MTYKDQRVIFLDMYSVKNLFLSNIKRSATNAVGMMMVLYTGMQHHQQIAAKYPDATMAMGVGHPDNPQRKIAFTPTHQQVSNTLSSNMNILFELYLSEIVAYWFDFLTEVYQKAFNDVFLLNFRRQFFLN